MMLVMVVVIVVVVVVAVVVEERSEEEDIRMMTGGHCGDWSLDCCQRFPRGGVVDDRKEERPCERKVQRRRR